MIVARVRRTLVERRLVAPGDRVLVACSGGPDSAALLWCLAQLAPDLSFMVSACCIDHGLRTSSAADVEVARAQAESLQVPFFTERLQLPPGSNVQARARTARYEALTRVAASQGATRIAVGHTMDDQAETVLMRLLRGGTLRAVAGIAPRRADGVIRPLIDCHRHDVHELARARFPRVADDPSNRDPRYERTRVRYELMPALEAENVGVVQHLASLADDARSTTAYLGRQAQRLLRKPGRPKTELVLAELRGADPAVRREAIRLWLWRTTRVRATRAHLLQLEQALVGRGEVWLPDGWVVRPDRDGTLRARRGPVKT